MLDWFAAQRFATQNGPLAGERRLCMFAKMRGPGAPGSSDEDDDFDTPEAKKGSSADKIGDDTEVKMHIDGGIDAIRSRLEGVIDLESRYCRETRENCEEVQETFNGIRSLMGQEFHAPDGTVTNARKHIKKNGTDAEKEMFLGLTQFLERSGNASAEFRAIIEVIAQWQRGELSPEDFRSGMKIIYDPENALGQDPQGKLLVENAKLALDEFVRNYGDDKWFANNFSPDERRRARMKLDADIKMEEILMTMNGALKWWKELNNNVRKELVKALPKRANLTHTMAIGAQKCLGKPMEDWQSGNFTPHAFQILMHELYAFLQLPDRKEREAEIEKFVQEYGVRWATATPEEKTEWINKINSTIGLEETTKFAKHTVGIWTEERVNTLEKWKGGRLPEEFFNIMMDLSELVDPANTVKRVQAWEAFQKGPKEAYDYMLAEFGADSSRVEELQEILTTAGTTSWDALNASSRFVFRECFEECIQLRYLVNKAKALVPPRGGVPMEPGGPGGTPPPPGTPAPPAGGTTPPTPPEDPSNPRTASDDGGNTEKPKLDEPANIDPVALQAHQGGLFRQMGIEFYSINDMIGGVKRVIEAYKHGFHERTVLKETAFASLIGKGIPGWTYLSGEVKLTVEKENDSSKDKETREFKEYLEERHFTFAELFEGHGEISMSHLQAEPPKARAVLEYAASRGWLYDTNAAQSQHKFQILGYDLENICSDWGTGPDAKRKRENYFIKLAGQNASGVKSEISHGKEKEHYTDKAHLFIKAINHALDEMNYWEAVGIAQRAIERGLEGEISPWIALTVMRRIREDETARKYVTDQVLDQFGLIGFVHTARTLGALKVGRKGIGEWAKDPSKDFGEIDSEHEGVCYYSIKIENMIKAASGKKYETLEEKRELDRLVARVLAAQIVPVGSTYISIFDAELFPYAEEIVKNNYQGESRPKDEDDDYYNNVSDVILADREVFKNIFVLSGSGKFTNGPKPNFLLNTMLKHYGVLKQYGGPGAAENYRKLASDKFNSWIEFWIRENRGGPAYVEQMPRPVVVNGVKVEYAILALIQARFIDFEMVKSYCKQLSKTSVILSQGIMEQLANYNGKTPNDFEAQARAHLATLSTGGGG